MNILEKIDEFLDEGKMSDSDIAQINRLKKRIQDGLDTIKRINERKPPIIGKTGVISVHRENIKKLRQQIAEIKAKY